MSVQINDLLQVKTIDDDSSAICLSRVEDLTEEEILISWPTDRGIRIPVSEHQTLYLSLTQPDSILAFKATVRRRISEPIAMIAVRPSGPPQRIERRENLRVVIPVNVELAARVVPLASFRQARETDYFIRTRTINLSGGGFIIHHYAPVPVNTLFDVRMFLSRKAPPLAFTAKVVRCSLKEVGEQEPAFEMALSYTRIPESARAQIVRHVFKAQRNSFTKK